MLKTGQSKTKTLNFLDDEELDSPSTSQKSKQSTAPRGNYKMVLVCTVKYLQEG